jgi:hypothetical protein
MKRQPDKDRFYLQLFLLELQARWTMNLVAGYDNDKILLWKKRARWPHQWGKPLRVAWQIVQRWVKSNQLSDNLNYQFPDQSLPVWESAGFTLLDEHENSSKENSNREPGCIYMIEY